MGHPDSKDPICSTVQYNYLLNRFFFLPRIGSLNLRWVTLPIADKRMGYPDSKDPICSTVQYDYLHTLNKFFSLPRIGSLDLRWVILLIADKRGWAPYVQYNYLHTHLTSFHLIGPLDSRWVILPIS